MPDSKKRSELKSRSRCRRKIFCLMAATLTALTIDDWDAGDVHNGDGREAEVLEAEVVEVQGKAQTLNHNLPYSVLRCPQHQEVQLGRGDLEVQHQRGRENLEVQQGRENLEVQQGREDLHHHHQVDHHDHWVDLCRQAFQSHRDDRGRQVDRGRVVPL